jgi:hypothetical protein
MCYSRNQFTQYFIKKFQKMTTTSSPAAIKPAKVITLETNFNNKLGCPAFIHIDLSPVKYPLRQELENRIIEIRTKDNSFPPVQVRVDNIQTVTFQQINDMMAWVSHAKTAMQLADFLFNKYHPDFSWTTEVSIYFYLSFSSKDLS